MIDKFIEFCNRPMQRQFLFFDDMLTPKLVRAGYWLGLVAVAWHGLGIIFSGGLGNLLEGVVFIVIGGLVLRVIAELVMLFFQIQENIETIANNSEKPAVRTIKKKAGTAKKVTKKE